MKYIDIKLIDKTAFTIFPIVLFSMLSLFLSSSCLAQGTIRLYIDADRSGTQASSVAIERGIRTALHEVNNEINQKNVEIVIRNHHGSSVRSLDHLKEYLKDDKAIALFSGLHSPPLLENLKFINEKRVLVLDPWAAAGPITRYPASENWVFRLSIDDTKAGEFIVKKSFQEGFRKPYLLLEDTGWGKSNLKTMSKALEKKGLDAVGVEWFNWNLGLTGAKIKLRKMQQAGADVIFLVANATEGKIFSKAMLDLNAAERLPVRSHWGITGGDFPYIISAEERKKMDLKFLQTRFSFISSEPTSLSRQVLMNAQQLFPNDIKSALDIKAPTGFIHAYDLTRLLIAACKNMEWSGNIKKDRQTLRLALENLNNPVEGLIKTYIKPFSEFHQSNPDAHEALDINDFTMAYYGEKNQIILDNKK